MMSSQVMEQMQSIVVVKEHSEDLPLTSSYESAMEALSSLIISKNRGDGSSVGGKYEKLERMTMYLKGSTCTFCEAILQQCGFRTGLFTSPHLIDVREISYKWTARII